MLYAVLGTLITAMLAMVENSDTDEIQHSINETCTLSNIQTATIRAVMTGTNTSCYTVTLGSIMK